VAVALPLGPVRAVDGTAVAIERRGADQSEGTSMMLLIGLAAIAMGFAIAVGVAARRRTRGLDVGAVSESWIAQHASNCEI